MIGVTEPRIVATVSMAERVGREMNKTLREVSYQYRLLVVNIENKCSMVLNLLRQCTMLTLSFFTISY